MNVFKKILVWVLSLLFVALNVYAEEQITYSYITEINRETGELVTTEESMRENVDFSMLDVMVFEDYPEGDEIKFRIIYEGRLGEYDNGLWNNVDFDKIDFLQVINSEYDKIRFILPAYKYNPGNTVVVEPNKNNITQNRNNIMPSQSGLSVSPKITLKGIEVNEQGMRIIDNGNMICTLNVENNSGTPNEITVILATYTSDGKLYNINSYSSDIAANENKTIEFEYMFDAENEHTGKIMMWNSLSAMKPVRATVDFSQTSGVNAYYYDSDNRLLQVDKSNGKSLIFTYDNMGNLLSKTVTQ